MSVTSNRSGKDTTRRAQPVKRLTLEETLQEIRQRRVILTPGATGRLIPWSSPNTRLAREIRSAISAHNRELQRMIARSDTRTCAAPDLHRFSWRYAGRGSYSCEVCERLLPEVS